MNKYWSGRIRGVEPYVPGEQPQDHQLIKINTNENPYGPGEKVEGAIGEKIGDTLRLYPDPDGTELKEALAAYCGIRPENVFVGNGSDEILAFCFLAFFDADRKILFPDITYGFYPVYAEFFKVPYACPPLKDDFTINIEDYFAQNGGIVIANPNAPTGIALSVSQIAEVARKNMDSVVIIDEAYVDFGAESAIRLLGEFKNLLIVQTMSKSRSLAGMRIGYAMGDENLIEALVCVKNSINSYTLNRLSLAAAVASVGDEETFEKNRAKIISTREKTVTKLKGLGFCCTDSKSNFIFASHPELGAKYIMSALRERGILVRYFEKPRIDNHLRITVGTDDEMEKLIAALTEILGRESRQ
jgi:histidinol-phosphate aminotransferase